MAEADISLPSRSGKTALKIIPTPFEEWAAREGYNIAPAVSPSPIRQYADRQTQDAYQAFNAGAASTARALTESTLETVALRERMKSTAKSP